MSQTKRIVLTSALAPFAPLAAARLSTLYTGLAIELGLTEVTLAHQDPRLLETASGEFLHLIYQEKIYEDAREIRHGLFQRLVGS